MTALPGVPLPSGFAYAPTEDVPGATLSPEGRAEVLRVIDEVDRSRRVAGAHAHETIG